MFSKGALLTQGIVLAILIANSFVYAENKPTVTNKEENISAEHPAGRNNLTEKVHASLELKPARCIALHRGQTCYQRTKILWKTSAMNEVCIFEDNQNQALQCWQSKSKGILKIDFQSSSDKVYILKTGDQIIASAEMRVAWVYNRGEKSVAKKQSWRMF